MRRFGVKQMAILVALLVTTSCGGGGSAGMGGSSTSTVTPTPSPDPAPPSPSYADASDFTRDRSFTGIGLRVAVDRTGPTPTSDTRVDPEAAAIGFDFLASTRLYQARYNAETVTAVTQLSTAGPPTDRFIGPNGSFSRSPLYIGLTATGFVYSTYTGYVLWTDFGPTSATGFTRRYILFGTRTVVGDLPTSGTASFTGFATLSGGPPQGGFGGSDAVVVDFTARTVTATADFELTSTGGTGSSTRPPTPPETITFAGSLDPATGRISGAATHVPTGATGRFEGALYGPRGAEAALVFAITTADGTLYYGIVEGGRN